ncbi:MAG: hypothetical protein ABIQ66_09625 [Novosphingobium sp.]
MIGAVDHVVLAVMSALQAMGERQSIDQSKPPLAAFRKATAVGAKGAKWTVAGVIGLGVLFMVGAAIFMPRVKPEPNARRATPASATTVVADSDRGVIGRQCRAGAYRGFPEIEKAECAGRPPVSPAPKGDAK